MATFPETRGGTVASPLIARRQATLPLPDPAPEAEAERRPLGRRTAPEIPQAEKGDVQRRDQQSGAGDGGELGATVLAAVEKRKELATKLREALSRTRASVGRVKMAADLQLLRRELARSHQVLGPLPTEGDFLSIVVLIEAELGKKTWKEITKEEITTLASAVAVGERQDRVTFDDYNRLLKTFHFSRRPTGPELNLEGIDDDGDGDEGFSPDGE